MGVLKGVLSTFLAFFLLGGVQFNLLNIVGICMNTAGGVLYTVSKYRNKYYNKHHYKALDFKYRALGGEKEEKEEQ